MTLAMIGFDWRCWPVVCQGVQRSSPPARVESPGRTREKAEQICFRKTVKIDDEIKLSSPDILYHAKDPDYGKRFESVSQAHTVDHQRLVCVAGHVDNFSAGLSHRNRNACR